MGARFTEARQAQSSEVAEDLRPSTAPQSLRTPSTPLFPSSPAHAMSVSATSSSNSRLMSTRLKQSRCSKRYSLHSQRSLVRRALRLQPATTVPKALRLRSLLRSRTASWLKSAVRSLPRLRTSFPMMTCSVTAQSNLLSNRPSQAKGEAQSNHPLKIERRPPISIETPGDLSLAASRP